MKFTSKEQYINYVKDAAIKIGTKYEYPVCLLISQACLENGYGLDSSCQSLVDHMNFLGMKASLLNDSWDKYSVWKGKSFVKNTPEVYNGREVRIDDAFRIYDSVEQCFEDYCLFMKYGSYGGLGGTPKYGNKVLGVGDPETVITRVMELGYCTGKTYASSNMRIIKEWNLTQYDTFKKSDAKQSSAKIVKLPALKINDITPSNKAQVPRSRGNTKIRFIVCHYLGVPNADNPYLYGGGYGGHYYVHRNGTVYCAANPKTAVVWHCGGGLQGSGGHQFHGICTNYNSIGIECGVYYTENVKEGDGDSNKWYFSEETQKSLVQLVSKLMDEYKISEDHVIRHYDVTGKICPNPYVKNNGLKTSWTWSEFKNNLRQYRKDGTVTIPDRSSCGVIGQAAEKVKEVAKSYLQKGDSGDAVKTMQKMLIALGYSCGSSGADGDFGANTLKAVKAFQKDYGLSIDGLYGVKSKAQLESAYKALSAKNTEAQNLFIETAKAVGKQAKAEGWKYNDSHSLPPCADKKISCDRIVARTLWNLGYIDQVKGGYTINNGLPDYLERNGFKKVTKKADVKPGAVVAVGNSSIEHVFIVETYNPKTDLCRKYDAGSDDRIKKACYFANVKLVEWSNRKFIAAWNVPSNLKGTKKKEEPQKEESGSGTTWHGVDYSPVYNYTYYRKKYADLRDAFGNDKDAYFKHFCNYGMKECRQASSSFNVKKYKARYEDLQKAYGDNWPKYYEHYCVYGKKEKRNAK